jgi:DNA polymerase III delta subunit
MAMIKSSDLKKKKEKNKKLKAMVKLDRSFLVCTQDTIEGGETRIEMRLSKCH